MRWKKHVLFSSCFMLLNSLPSILTGIITGGKSHANNRKRRIFSWKWHDYIIKISNYSCVFFHAIISIFNRLICVWAQAWVCRQLFSIRRNDSTKAIIHRSVCEPFRSASIIAALSDEPQLAVSMCVCVHRVTLPLRYHWHTSMGTPMRMTNDVLMGKQVEENQIIRNEKKCMRQSELLDQ